eukprot:COSAG02_NODE_1120_length_14453_cov_511.865055_1_plen_71_part_00
MAFAVKGRLWSAAAAAAEPIGSLHLSAPAALHAAALLPHDADRATTRGATSGGGGDEDDVAGRFDVLPAR